MVNFLIRCAAAMLLATSIMSVSTGTVRAQDGIASEARKPALRARQKILFDQMIETPQDLDLMFAYAGVSARLEDYEAAISTLERMLIFNADLPRVRLELGALYYRVGSYPVSERYFRSVAEEPDLPEGVSQRVDVYLSRIEENQRRNRFQGRIEAGVIADTNANLGPDDRGVLLFGQPALLDGDSVENGDVGARLSAEVTHRFDFGTVNNDHWRTDASYFGKHYKDEHEGDLNALYLRTGPVLSLNSQTFGPKLRPFVDVEYTNADGDSLYRGAGAGAELRAAPADDWSVFGELRGGYRDYFSRDNEDGIVLRARGGAAWLPGRDTILGASITLQRDEADRDFNSNTEGVIRISASYAYDPDLSFVDDKWVLSLYATAGYREFDDPDPVVTSGKTRRDREFRAGLSHVFALRDGFYTTIGATALHRDSNIKNFDLENLGVSASVGYKF